MAVSTERSAEELFRIYYPGRPEIDNPSLHLQRFSSQDRYAQFWGEVQAPPLRVVEVATGERTGVVVRKRTYEEGAMTGPHDRREWGRLLQAEIAYTPLLDRGAEVRHHFDYIRNGQVLGVPDSSVIEFGSDSSPDVAARVAYKPRNQRWFELMVAMGEKQGDARQPGLTFAAEKSGEFRVYNETISKQVGQIGTKDGMVLLPGTPYQVSITDESTMFASMWKFTCIDEEADRAVNVLVPNFADMEHIDQFIRGDWQAYTRIPRLYPAAYFSTKRGPLIY